MRLKNLILSDIRFQIKHGFYFLYIVITLFYISILSFVPEIYKSKLATLIIFTDPAVLGVSFMGVIILFEKSQRVLSSIAVSPVKKQEYICSKVLSLAMISTLAGGAIAFSSGSNNMIWVLIGVFVGSILFSLIGVIVGANISSINGFVIAIIPVMIVFMVPAIAEFFGYGYSIFFYHPSNITLRLISGNKENLLIGLAILIIWIFIFYKITEKAVCKMMASLGGTTI